jgi:hypothetical protein
MRLGSWNVAGRVRRLDEQAAIAGEAPDLVVLQESRRRPFLAGGRRSPTWLSSRREHVGVDAQHWPGRDRSCALVERPAG